MSKEQDLQKLDLVRRRVMAVLVVGLIALFVWVLVSHGSSDTSPTADPIAAQCEQNWILHRNDTLVGYLHSDYIKKCKTDLEFIQQLAKDHR
jgi:hypothetical protein